MRFSTNHFFLPKIVDRKKRQIVLPKRWPKSSQKHEKKWQKGGRDEEKKRELSGGGRRGRPCGIRGARLEATKANKALRPNKQKV